MIQCDNPSFNTRNVLCITLTAIGFISVALGIWQLYQPLISQYPASGWALIVPGALGATAILIWKGIQSVVLEERKPLPDRFAVVEREVGNFERFPKEIFWEIFSYLDLTSLGKVPQVSKFFFNKTKDFIDQSPKVRQKFENQRFLMGLKESKPQVLSKHDGLVYCVFCEDTFLFTGSYDDTIKVWKRDPYLGSWKCQETLYGHTDAIKSIFFADKMLFSGSTDRTIKVWQKVRDKWACQATLSGHTKAISSVFYGEKMLFSASSDCSIKIWQKNSNDANWSNIATLHGHTSWVNCIFFKDEMLFSGSMDNSIIIWQKDSQGKWGCQSTLLGHQDWVSSVIYNEGMLFSGSKDCSIKIWRKDSQDNWGCQATLLGHAGLVNCIFYTNGMLLSASLDGTIKMWQEDLNDHNWNCKANLQGYDGTVYQNIFCRNKTLFYGSKVRKIKVWQP